MAVPRLNFCLHRAEASLHDGWSAWGGESTHDVTSHAESGCLVEEKAGQTSGIGRPAEELDPSSRPPPLHRYRHEHGIECSLGEGQLDQVGVELRIHVVDRRLQNVQLFVAVS